MKFTTTASLTALAGTAAADFGNPGPKPTKGGSSLNVMHFNSGYLMMARVDPIVAPGGPSPHVHVVQGGSNFGVSATGKEMLLSKCTTSVMKADNSAYWVPTVYFHDEKKGTFESVDHDYTNVYYFVDATDDDVVPFPVGLSIVSGDAMLRSLTKKDFTTNLDPSMGTVNPVQFTCPRLNNVYDPPSWDNGSDGSMYGVGNSVNLGEGWGFPDHNCDGLHSPLRADVHFPSCYSPDIGLTNFRENMAFPTAVPGSNDGTAKLNCPKSHPVHVPHLFFETYWRTDKFAGRWDYNQKKQPFVLADGDVTGYSSHGDFLAGWDTEVLQTLLENCNQETQGFESCDIVKADPEKYLNTATCTMDSPIKETVTGTLTKLPGNNPLGGWSYGTTAIGGMSGGSTGAAGSSGGDDTTTAAAVAAQTSAPTKPKATAAATKANAQTSQEQAPAYTAAPANGDKAEEQPTTAAAAAATTSAAVQFAKLQSATSSTCKHRKTKTIWETIYATETVAPSHEKPAKRDQQQRRSAQHREGHLRRSHGHHF